MDRYEKYKDSSVQWIGEIPQNWEIVKFNHYVFLKHGYQFRDYDFTQSGLKIIKITQLKANGELETENVSFIDENRLDDFKEIIINKGDILMALTGGTIGKIIKVKDITEPLLQNYRVGNFYPLNEKLHKSFLFWILSSNYILGQIFFDQRETGQPNIGKENFGRMFLTIPKTTEEQTAIANYLDRKTAEIDELIAKKEKLLELYEEEKTAIINQAVTKGVTSSGVEMKDSGIDWLGEIPEHWEVKRVAIFGNFSKGKGIPHSELKDNGFPAILYGDIYTKYNIKADIIKNYINEETTKTSVAIKKGDLLFTGSGETVEDIGKCIAYVGDETAYVGGDVIILRQKKYDSLFLSYSLSSNASIYQKARMAKGQIIIHIYASNLREILLPVPKKEEQTTIVQHIEKETARINTKAENTKKLIELLKEYKTSLISEVVTGKKKVC